jgi:Serine dehydrogenase proteinase
VKVNKNRLAIMSRAKRVELYGKIEAHRKRPLIVYATSKRRGATAEMATDALPYIIEQLDSIPANSSRIDLLISSYGGDPMVAWRIMSLIRQRVKNVSVLIPQSAYSAATLLALGGNEIIMHPNGHLGPVDMQINAFHDGRRKNFSTEAITAFLDFVRDNLKITDQEHIRMLFEVVCKEIGTLNIGFTTRSARLAIDLGERLLALHMKDDGSGTKLRSLVENMSKEFQSHNYPINREEAISIGLPVKKLRDKKLEELMWASWLEIEDEMKERTPFNPLIELLGSNQSGKLLEPTPQLLLPVNAGSPGNFSATIPDVTNASSTKIDPVDFEIKEALVESARMSHTGLTRGKILSCRTPNLVIHYNAIPTFQGWVKEA